MVDVDKGCVFYKHFQVGGMGGGIDKAMTSPRISSDPGRWRRGSPRVYLQSNLSNRPRVLN
ncbi:hypothetical protein NC651_025364 [Populus alba x Populus x berolinensis]|nr:hypothetical protein NC651_025364 [Populus alba x Populus x berolinensis]